MDLSPGVKLLAELTLRLNQKIAASGDYMQNSWCSIRHETYLLTNRMFSLFGNRDLSLKRS